MGACMTGDCSGEFAMGVYGEVVELGRCCSVEKSRQQILHQPLNLQL